MYCMWMYAKVLNWPLCSDLTLTQSVAIMEYLHDTHPGAGLLPVSPGDRARVRMVTEIICSGTQPIQVHYIGSFGV